MCAAASTPRWSRAPRPRLVCNPAGPASLNPGSRCRPALLDRHRPRHLGLPGGRGGRPGRDPRTRPRRTPAAARSRGRVGREQDPGALVGGRAHACCAQIAVQLPDRQCVALAVDGTSATLLLGRRGRYAPGSGPDVQRPPGGGGGRRHRGPGPARQPGAGADLGLAKLIHLGLELARAERASWPCTRRIGSAAGSPAASAISDWNNALKLGFDRDRLVWPRLGPGPGAGRGSACRRWWHPGPDRHPGPRPGEGLGLVTRHHGPGRDHRQHGGRDRHGRRYDPGDAVTCLGSTLVLKVVSPRPVASAHHGVYSQRFGDGWLAGGASNSGGAVLLQHFSLDGTRYLVGADRLHPASGLDYYPLPGVGERFPRYDPDLAAPARTRARRIGTLPARPPGGDGRHRGRGLSPAARSGCTAAAPGDQHRRRCGQSGLDPPARTRPGHPGGPGRAPGGGLRAAPAGLARLGPGRSAIAEPCLAGSWNTRAASPAMPVRVHDPHPRASQPPSFFRSAVASAACSDLGLSRSTLRRISIASSLRPRLSRATATW